MLNYEKVEDIHTSSSGKTIVLKVKERNSINDRFYALKLVAGIDNNLQKLIFNREIEALNILNTCDGIVKILNSETSVEYDGKTYGGILLEYVHGENLDNIEFTNYSQLEKYQICLKILRAVSCAHNFNVIHRDLKPSNIILNETTGKITIIDFGSSKIKSIIESETTMPLFSEYYSAQEVIMGTDITEASDIYSLGVIIFKILLGVKPGPLNWMYDVLNVSSLRQELKELLSKMLREDIHERISDINEVIEVFTKLIGELNTGTISCNIFIDSDKLWLLKNKNLIPQDTTMSIFTQSILKRDFIEKYGFFDERKQSCFITGKSLQIECLYESSNGKFLVSDIRDLPVDRRSWNIRKSFRIDGTLEFSESGKGGSISPDNKKLWVMFQNHLNDFSSSRAKEELFDDLFGAWQKGIDEAVKNEEEKVGKINYTNWEIIGRELILKLGTYVNKSIDDISVETKYIIKDDLARGKTPFYIPVGNYYDVQSEDDEMNIIISLAPNAPLAKIKSLLNKKVPVIEDFQANVGAYKKQFRAMKALRDDNCSVRNLKDIILNIEEPTSVTMISNFHPIDIDLNPSQIQAVKKALESENISLIQGPPGTGKTSVIKEIVAQIILMVEHRSEIPKILIVSQSHTAVDNILEDLDVVVSNKINIIRIGKEKDISQKISGKYTMAAIKDGLYEDIQKNAEEYRSNRDIQYKDVTDEEELERWEKIKKIQSDWLKRCGDFNALDYNVLRNASIIAGTCIGFLANNFIKEMTFDYVIIDEAAKATTPELLVSIIKAKKIVLVGDQNQLPAYSDERVSPTLAKLTKSPDFRLFDILFNNLPASHKQILTTQYRMISNIGNLISKVFYRNTIDTGINDNDRRHCIKKYEGYSILWFNTSLIKRHNQDKSKGGSFINQTEKEIIKAILEDFKDSNDLSRLDIGIITGYSGQKELLRKMVQNNGFDSVAKKIDINTLDAFQGRQNDIIIYSTVRTSDSIGFQKEKERVNVAFSRARRLLIICGDMDFFYHYDNPDNKFIEIIDYIKEHNAECKIINCKDGGKI